MILLVVLFFRLLLSTHSTVNPTPQLGCSRHCITTHLQSRVVVRARSSTSSFETTTLAMGTFETLGIVDLQRQLNLAFGYTTSLTFQHNRTHLSQPLSTDLQLIEAFNSKMATRMWTTNHTRQTKVVPLVELTVHVQQVPVELIALALGGETVNSFIWQLASRTSGDPLAKVDVRLDRILVGSMLTKEDVGIEIPRELTVGRPMSEGTRTESSTSSTTTYIPSATPIAPNNVIVGIVIDNKKKYLEQGLRWLTSWKEKNSNIKVLVCILPGVSAAYQLYVTSTFSFITIRKIMPLSKDLPNATPHSNKLRLLEQPECNAKAVSYQPFVHSRYQYCIYMDTDILILNNDVLSYLNPNQSVGFFYTTHTHTHRQQQQHHTTEPLTTKRIPFLSVSLSPPTTTIQQYYYQTLQFRAGRTLWAQTASNDPAWHRIFELAGVIRSHKDSSALASHWPNTGILVFPTKIVPQFLFDWIHYTDKTLQWLTALKQDVYFTETISFLLTMLMTAELTYELLPIQMNTQMNLPRFDFKRNGYDHSLEYMGECTVLHYPLNTLVMDDVYHIPQPYNNATLLNFPFVHHVNQRLLELRPAMERTMQGWSNARG